jgi:RNA polymerase sigma factor (TIGR02999 family)
MSEPRLHDITMLLQEVKPDDSGAADRLFPLLYDELKRMASGKMADTPGGGWGKTLHPTALVHEAFVRLVGKSGTAFENRRHFFFAAARAMQDILVEEHRRRLSRKRGGGSRGVPLGEHDVAESTRPVADSEDAVEIAAALDKLERADERKAQIVRLRYFAGLSAQETAQALSISLSTVEREWRFAKSLLHTMILKAIQDGSRGGDPA